MLSIVSNFSHFIIKRFFIFRDALIAIVRLFIIFSTQLFGYGTLKERMKKLIFTLSIQNLIFRVLRAFKPNLSFSKIICKSYKNTGTILVTRRDDVLDVLSRDADFEVVFGERMKKLTDGENFFLGMQPSEDYQKNVSMIRLAMRQSDITDILLPRINNVVLKAIKHSEGKIDFVQDIGKEISCDIICNYFGLSNADPESIKEWGYNLVLVFIC